MNDVVARGRPLERRARSLARNAESRYRTPQVARLLSSCAPLRPTAARQRVVLLVSAANRRQVPHWVANLPGHRVMVVGEGATRRPGIVARRASSLPELHEALKRLGAVHLIVDLRSADVVEARQTWRTLFFHLLHGGAYLVPHRPSGRKAVEAELTTWSAEIAGLAPKEESEATQRGATAGVALLPDCLAIVKRGHHYLTLFDDEVDAVLPTRERGAEVEILQALPPGELQSRVQVNSYESAVGVGWPAQRMPYPSMRLRHYRAPIVFAGRTLLYTGHSILPDSFRFYRGRRMEHPAVGSVSHDFRTLPRGLGHREDLEGDYFVLDPQWTGHFGHIMTEVVARLWAWDEAKARFPDLKVLHAVTPGQTSDPLISRLLGAYGIPQSDLVAVEHPVRVRSVLAATAMWHNHPPHFVHPDITRIWDRIGRTLIDTSAPSFERIFVSRRPTQPARVCHNSAEVEALFESYGFTVVFPEDLDVSAQAQLFREAEVVAGFGGSAMFNLMYAQQLEHLILLSHEAYTARNEHLYSSLLGGQAHYFWSTPDIQQTPGKYNWRAFVSNWTFDFERNGVALEKVLSELGSGQSRR